MRKIIDEIPVGDAVICDICNNDFTKSDKKGGFIFAGKGYCPLCQKEGMRQIEKYEEERYIDAVCPEDQSFADFIRDYRGEDAKITITAFE